jgi:hypothetical protein
MTNSQPLATIRTGIIAGAAGGLAEMAWIILYAGITGGDPAVLARGVTTAAGLSAFLPSHPAVIGISVHMGLALLLGVALVALWRLSGDGRFGRIDPYCFMLAALLGIWAINFFVVLPVVSPAFIRLAPYAVSLTSKLLFGAAAATVIVAQQTVDVRDAVKVIEQRVVERRR